MDDLDKKILMLLEQNARMPVKDIARHVALTSPAVSSRIHRLEQEGIIGCVINDPLAVAYLCRLELCGGFDAYTAVETKGISIGQSVVDAENFWKKAPNSRVLTGVNTEEFMTMLLYRLCGGEESEIRKMMAYSCRGGDGL